MNDQVFVRPVSLEGKPLGPAIEIGTMGYRMVDASGEVVQEVNWVELEVENAFEEEAELDAQGARSGTGTEEGSAGTDWECLECGSTAAGTPRPESLLWCLGQAVWLARRALSGAWNRLMVWDR